MRRLNPLSVLAAAAIAFSPLARTASAADPGSGSPSIAIVNVQKVFDSIHEAQDYKSQNDLDIKSFQSAAVDKENNIKAMQAALTYLKSDSPAYADQAQKLESASIEYEIWGKEKQLTLERADKNRLKAIFLEIEDAVAQVAQKDGISLVLADQRPQIPDDLEKVTPQELQARISQRTVLFSDQSRDISGEVITLLDKNYAAKTAAPPSQEPPK
jgi:Skp family chaperone for outer membrane proteins